MAEMAFPLMNMIILGGPLAFAIREMAAVKKD